MNAPYRQPEEPPYDFADVDQLIRDYRATEDGPTKKALLSGILSTLAVLTEMAARLEEGTVERLAMLGEVPR
jgi:hypothetical protein